MILKAFYAQEAGCADNLLYLRFEFFLPSFPHSASEAVSWMQMKSIPLYEGVYPGLSAKVDDEDYDRLRMFSWYPDKGSYTFYAVRKITHLGKSIKIRMHQDVLGCESKQEVDHRDQDGLNNQKLNLRYCTRSQNNGNHRKRRDSSSRFKGVVEAKHVKFKKFKAWISKDKRTYILGYFYSAEEAAAAYNQKAVELFGEFARLNNVG